MWSQNRIGPKKGNGDAGAYPDDRIVFIHQDYTVTGSALHNEDIIFNRVDAAWQEFCANSLKFKVPTDLDLIVQTDSNLNSEG